MKRRQVISSLGIGSISLVAPGVMGQTTDEELPAGLRKHAKNGEMPPGLRKHAKNGELPPGLKIGDGELKMVESQERKRELLQNKKQSIVSKSADNSYISVGKLSEYYWRVEFVSDEGNEVVGYYDDGEYVYINTNNSIIDIDRGKLKKYRRKSDRHIEKLKKKRRGKWKEHGDTQRRVAKSEKKSGDTGNKLLNNNREEQ